MFVKRKKRALYLSLAVFFSFALGWTPSTIANYDFNQKASTKNYYHERMSSGDYHDACLAACDYGDVVTISMIMSKIALLDNPIPLEDRVISCDVVHCVDALVSLTGEDFGHNYKGWEKWWKEEGKVREPESYDSETSESCIQWRAANER